MPPKKARGGARGGRGGRGGSSGPAAPPPAEELDQRLEIQISSSSSAANRAETLTTPEKTTDEGDRMDLDPNDSPATQPTETPASTPLRPPPSLQMQPPDGPAGVSSRGGTRGRGKESKFKPKNVRRSASELKALADQESERVAAAAANAARLRGRGNAFRARAGRGRGDAMGRGRGGIGGVASGPFAVAPEIGRRGGFAPGVSGVSGLKRESGPNTSGHGGSSGLNIKREHAAGGFSKTAGPGSGSRIPDPEYPDEDKNVPRVDIQHINFISSDDEDEDDDIIQTGSRYKPKASAATGSSKGGLRPVRLDRHEHKDRRSQVNTGPPIKDMAAEGGLDSETPVVDEQRSTGGRREEKKVFKGVYTDEDTQVKDEPEEPMDGIDQLAPEAPAPGSAAELRSGSVELDTDEDTTSDDEPAPKGKKKAYARKQPAKFVIQTEEDRQEYERHLEDLEILKEELGGMQQPISGKGKGKEHEGDDAEKPVDKKEGRLYLFQFPPVMPKLYNPAKEPKADTGNSDMPVDEDDVQVTASVDKTAIDLEQRARTEGEETIIKKEDDEPKQKKKGETLAEEAGYVGKLIVRESGRVELDWGGSRMLVGRGIETSFLSMGVLVDSKNCYDREGKPTGEGVATGMGKIMGKFVVTPDWESMVADIDRAERRERRRERRTRDE